MDAAKIMPTGADTPTLEALMARALDEPDALDFLAGGLEFLVGLRWTPKSGPGVKIEA